MIIGTLLHDIVAAGFLTNPAVRTAIVVGALSATVSSVVGLFTVVRGQSFAGHALSDIGAAGGSGAALANISPLLGFVAMNLIGAFALEAFQPKRVRGRDLVTGVVLGAVLGIAALFLYLDTTLTTSTGTTVSVLFGSLFTLPSNSLPLAIGIGSVSIFTIAWIYRPLLLSSVSPELAQVQGVRVRWISLVFLLALAAAVSLSALLTGAILSTALLIGPPTIATRRTNSIRSALVLSIAIGIGVTLAGILLSYDSVAWTSQGVGWPVSFCIVALLTLVFFLLPRRTHTVGEQLAKDEPRSTPTPPSSSALVSK
ncbi:MAG: metal ABC transporter permease [Acidimicrobiales bacterium]